MLPKHRQKRSQSQHFLDKFLRILETEIYSLKIQKNINRHKMIDSKIFWQVQNRFILKTGWPIYSYFDKLNNHLQNQFYFFGQTLLSDISFLTNCKFTEYILQSCPKNKICQKFFNKQFILRKTTRTFKMNQLNFPILLIRSHKEISFIGIHTDTTLKLYKKQF